MNHFTQRLLRAWVILLCLLAPNCLLAEATETNASKDPKEVEVVQRSTHSVWYDSRKGQINPNSAVQANIDVSDRYRSIAKPKDAVTRSSGGGGFSQAIADLFSFLFQFWQIILVVCLIAIIAAIVFVVLKQGSFYVPKSSARSQQQEERKKASITDLPFELEQTQLGLLGQAELYRSQGDYSKAIIYLFSHVLVEMDHARCIRLTRGKTNRTYLRELKGREQLRGFANQVMHAFEYAFFGKHRLSQSDFEKIWQQLPAFERYLKQVDLAEVGAESKSTLVAAT